MKKIFNVLSVIALGLLLAFTSCNKGQKAPEATTTETTTTTPEPAQPATTTEAPTTTEVVNAIEVPTFAAKEVNDFCNEYKTIMTDYGTLKGTADKVKEAELQKRFVDWSNKTVGIVAKLKADEMQKFNDYITECEKNFKSMATATTK